ncbi:glycosyl hydrolase [Paenibacillus polymyxa]|uniref:Glycosyl hydrolase n=1 Tax=Paenibacillus polymyxa TaxID=1406 RepID=A0A378XPD0_PAEPO|nr:glycosyl hydrolase [Paenibacillus polymyxa]
MNGEVIALDQLEKGYVEIQCTWKDGDVVTLHLAMPVERIRSNPLVSMNQQQIALQRGPVVYCLEEADNGANLAGLRLPKDSPITEEFSENLLGGIVKLTIEGHRVKSSNALYSSEPLELVPQQITAIPYYAWCNRAKGEMRVWVYES